MAIGINIMNLLTGTAYLLLLILTILGILAYVRQRHQFKEIESKARHSGIKEFTE